jgi:hypothetical protein
VRSILVDAGPLIALFRSRDRHHAAARAVVEANPAMLVTTWPVITEACHFLDQAGKRALLSLVRRGGLQLEALDPGDLAGLDGLLARYGRMDLADATLVHVAAKTGITEVFTIDRRDFETYRTPAGKRFKLLLPA